jgi:dCMP deaminase
MRPSFETIYMRLALDLEKRSTCQRKQVGCVITTTDFRKVLAVGYNGNAEGLPNSCDDAQAEHRCGCLHAEENSIINCDSPRSLEKYVFVTWSPCIICAKRLINLGNVKKVFYHQDYSSDAGLKTLNKVGILTEKYTSIDI